MQPIHHHTLYDKFVEVFWSPRGHYILCQYPQHQYQDILGLLQVSMKWFIFLFWCHHVPAKVTEGNNHIQWYPSLHQINPLLLIHLYSWYMLFHYYAYYLYMEYIGPVVSQNLRIRSKYFSWNKIDFGYFDPRYIYIYIFLYIYIYRYIMNITTCTLNWT